jgi:hypothetical protein
LEATFVLSPQTRKRFGLALPGGLHALERVCVASHT